VCKIRDSDNPALEDSSLKTTWFSFKTSKPQTVQTLLTAASRGISDNAVTDSVTR
jgi:hypothetical protein